MTPQEREIIGGLFDKVKTSIPRDRDPDAERFIGEQLSANPGAAYAMAQTIHAQDQMMQQMNAAIEDLQYQLREMQSRPQGGFLSSLFGGGARPVEPPMRGRPYGAGPNAGPGMPPPLPQTQASPWGNRQQAPAAGGGFLAGAMSTAAGVAGGMLLASAVMSAFGGDEAKASEAGADNSAGSEPSDAGGGDDFSSGFDGGEF